MAGAGGSVAGAGGSSLAGAGGGAAGAAGSGAAGSGAAGAAGSGAAGSGAGGAGGGAAGTAGGALAADVQNIVIIFAENRSFDSLFGSFPGANGLGNVSVSGAAGAGGAGGAGATTVAYIPQKDRDGTTVLPKLPQTWGGVTLGGNPTVVTQAQSDNIPNAPFPMETIWSTINGAPLLTTLDVSRDIAHRFFEHQMELNGGSNDMFAAWEDGGGITMGNWDYSKSKLYALAQQYVLADNFYMGAFGGSFLTHQYLICACAPTVSAAWVASNKPSVNMLGTANSKGVPQLALNTAAATPTPASALDGPPAFLTGNIAPLNYFGTADGYRAVNTMQPFFQPSGNPPAARRTCATPTRSTAARCRPRCRPRRTWATS